jgi:hypothetical protein
MSLSGRISVPTFPSVVIPTASAHTTRFAMLAGRYLRDRGIALLSQANVERALLSALPEVADPLLPSIFVDDPRFTDIARGFRACLAAAPTSVQLGHVHARCALAHGLGYESIHALQAVLTGTSPVRVVESGPVRLVINPTGHWTQRGGELVLPDRRPRHPVWYVALADERTGLFLFRLTDSQPEPAGVASLVMRLLVHNGTLPNRVYMAHSLRGPYSDVFRALTDHHIQVLSPPRSGQGAVGHRIQTFLSHLRFWLERCRESMASCQEIGDAVGHPAAVCVPLHETGPNDVRHVRIAHHLAEEITRRRGRDPEAGRSLREQETRSAPLNKGGRVPPPEDVLMTLLHEEYEYESLVLNRLDKIAHLLLRIRQTPAGERAPLLLTLGALMIRRTLELWAEGQYHLSVYPHTFPDPTLQSWITEGVREVMKRSLLVEAQQVQAMAARAVPTVAERSGHLVLRAVPGHHLLEERIKTACGTSVVVRVLPELRPRPSFSHLLECYWSPLRALRYPNHTPFTPSRCIRPPSTNPNWPTGDLYLTVLGQFPVGTVARLPVGDVQLAHDLTAHVNARLARNPTGFACTIEPFASYGDLMEIDPKRPFGF